MILNREAILSLAGKREFREIDVPEMGGMIRLRSMNGLEREQVENKITAGPTVEARARLVAASVCDERGHLMFGEMDLPLLNCLPWHVLHRIKQAAEDMSAMTPAAMEDAEKNSPTPS